MSLSNGQASVDPKQAAEVLLGTIKWESDHKGFCECPGAASHSSSSGKNECVVYLNGSPTIFCFHQSCAEEVQAANLELRRTIGWGPLPPNASKREVKEKAKEQSKQVLLEQRSRSSLSQILAQYRWTVEEMRKSSPGKPSNVLSDQWKDLLSLYKPDDVVWIGEKWDSGSAEKQRHFRTASEWLNGTAVAGPLTCPATFKANSFSRGNDNVNCRRYLVVESDTLAKAEIGAVFQWLSQEVGLTLRAVVDTAGKSLHGWFDFPKKAVLDELEIILPQLGCDKGLFTASQPCRIPGAVRDGKHQELLYLDKEKKAGTVKKPSSVLPLPRLYFSDQAQCYYRETTGGTWQKINEKALDTELKAQGFSFEVNDGELLSEADRTKRSIQLNNGVAFVGRLAGYMPGPREMMGRKILITEGPKLIEPKYGDYPLIAHLVNGLLNGGGVDQTPYFYAWVKRAYQCLRSGDFSPGQALAIAGPKNSGKSLLQNLITEMLGGRMAKPYQFIAGKTNFNSGLFAAEHLAIEDEAASTRIENRRTLGAMIKAIIANETQACYIKGAEEITLKPFWRLSITLNEEPEDLMVLPPFEEGIGDKILLLKASPVTMKMPTDTAEQRAAYWDALVSEIPALLAGLQDWEPPDHLRGGRWGVETYHHPELLSKVSQLQPEIRLLELIDGCTSLINVCEDQWEGTAMKLEKELTHDDFSLRFQARNLLSYQNTCGTLLGRLASKRPDRVQKLKEANGYAVWKITKAVNGNN